MILVNKLSCIVIWIYFFLLLNHSRVTDSCITISDSMADDQLLHNILKPLNRDRVNGGYMPDYDKLRIVLYQCEITLSLMSPLDFKRSITIELYRSAPSLAHTFFSVSWVWLIGLYCHIPSSHHNTLTLDASLERCSWHCLQEPNQVRWELGSVVWNLGLKMWLI